MDNTAINPFPSLRGKDLHSVGALDKESRTEALLKKIIDKVNLTPESARMWAEEQIRIMDVDEHDESFILEKVVDFLDSPKGSELRVVLDFLLPLFDVSEFNSDMLFHQYEGTRIPKYSRIDLGYLRMIMGAFPSIWGYRFACDLLKVSQVAKMLHISEAKVRELAIEGKIKSTRSQGETGHYRFKPDWVLEYSEESQNRKSE